MSDRQLVADLLSALEYHTEQTRPIEVSRVAIKAAREYLRKLAQQEQEPVCDKDPQGCWSVRCQLGKVCKNTSPQRKPWVGLTLDEKHALNDALNLNGRFVVIDVIEAKVRGKNA